MRILTLRQVLSAAAVIASFAGCSGGGSSAIAPKPAPPQAGALMQTDRPRGLLGSLGQFNIKSKTGQHFVSRFSCPTAGQIEYVSDSQNSVVNVYAGSFVGQAPCGQIVVGIHIPGGLYVKTGNHDLYVANFNGNVLVFHRGQTTPYNSFTDPTGQRAVDVAVASDGTVIASNLNQSNGRGTGSISTWKDKPNGGKFVGNFRMTHDDHGLFVTVQENGTVYYNDIDKFTHLGALWSMSCPHGACGAQTQVAGVSFTIPAGMSFDDTGDLMVTDSFAHTVDIFELPNPVPSILGLGGSPVGMAFNQRDNHLFIAENNDAAEYSYPSGSLVGIVPGNRGGDMVGIAVDPSGTAGTP